MLQKMERAFSKKKGRETKEGKMERPKQTNAKKPTNLADRAD